MKYFWGTAALVWAFAALFSFGLATRPGIFPIGEDAVYIEDSACTVNMTADRSEEDILSDMLECIELHRG